MFTQEKLQKVEVVLILHTCHKLFTRMEASSGKAYENSTVEAGKDQNCMCLTPQVLIGVAQKFENF